MQKIQKGEIPNKGRRLPRTWVGYQNVPGRKPFKGGINLRKPNQSLVIESSHKIDKNPKDWIRVSWNIELKQFLIGKNSKIKEEKLRRIRWRFHSQEKREEEKQVKVCRHDPPLFPPTIRIMIILSNIQSKREKYIILALNY